jgi:inhibitor of cysteine peptidase
MDKVPDLTIAAGNCFDVTLSANPTTGYSWSLSGSPSLVFLLGEKAHKLPDPPSPRLGATTVSQVFHFQARRPGTEVLTFNYERSWERFGPPGDRHSVRVTIVGR